MTGWRTLPSVEIATRTLRYESAAVSATADAINDVALSDTPLSGEKEQPFQLLMAGFEALDLLNIGLVVSNSSGQLLLANRTAEQILETRDGLGLTARGILRVSGIGGRVLLELIREAASPESANSKDSVLAVQRPSGKRSFTLLVRSIAGRADRGRSEGNCLVFIMDPEFPVETAELELRQLYGLTSTEACLANLLMEGKTLDECCQSLDIRRSTARTHLQHLFEKVGVQRQSELVSLLLKSVGLVRARSPRPKASSALGTTA